MPMLGVSNTYGRASDTSKNAPSAGGAYIETRRDRHVIFHFEGRPIALSIGRRSAQMGLKCR